MSPETRKIGVFLLIENNSYQRATAREAMDAGRRHGVEIALFYAENLAVQQSRDILHFVNKNQGRSLGVVVEPVTDIEPASESMAGEALQKLARRVMAKGAAWLVLNRSVEARVQALRKEFPGVPAAVITADQSGFGRVQAGQFKTLLPRGGRVLYVLGSAVSSVSRDRRTAMLADVAGLTVEEVEGGWVAERTRDAVLKWMRRAQVRDGWPDLVGCQNDEMAMGAREALVRAANEFRRPDLARIPVTGGDGLPDAGQRFVDEKRLTATVIMPPLAGLAIDALVAHWNGGHALPLQTIVPVRSHPPVPRLTPIRAKSDASDAPTGVWGRMGEVLDPGA